MALSRAIYCDCDPVHLLRGAGREAGCAGDRQFRLCQPWARSANPVRDAKAVAEALRAAGFAEVAEGYDLSKPQFDAALKRFGDAAAGADWALIYYAGHGIGIGGETYVLPVDAVLAARRARGRRGGFAVAAAGEGAAAPRRCAW